MHGFAVAGDEFQFGVCRAEDGAARSLIEAVGLHTDQAVFHHITAADTIASADDVQFVNDLCRGHLFTVDGNRFTGFKFDFHIFRLIRSLFRRNRQYPEGFVRFGVNIFDGAAFMGDVPDVAVAAKEFRVLGRIRIADTLLIQVVQQVFAGSEIPDTPRGDDLQAGIQRMNAVFQTDLVVALVGAAVSDGVGVFLLGDFTRRLATIGRAMEVPR